MLAYVCSWIIPPSKGGPYFPDLGSLPPLAKILLEVPKSHEAWADRMVRSFRTSVYNEAPDWSVLQQINGRKPNHSYGYVMAELWRVTADEETYLRQNSGPIPKPSSAKAAQTLWEATLPLLPTA